MPRATVGLLDFHITALRELRRVTSEVRVFPLLHLDRRLSPHLGPVWAGFEVEVTPVEYEFQRAQDHAGNRMMRVRRRR
jgi:hypothetical protein